MDHFKSLQFVTILFLFSVLGFWPQGMWDLSSPTGIELALPALEGEVLITTRLPGKSLPGPLVSLPLSLPLCVLFSLNQSPRGPWGSPPLALSESEAVCTEVK